MGSSISFDNTQERRVAQLEYTSADNIDLDGIFHLNIVSTLSDYRSFETKRIMAVANLPAFNPGDTRPDSAAEVTPAERKQAYRTFSQQDFFLSVYTGNHADLVTTIARKLGIHPMLAQKWIKELKHIDNGEDASQNRQAQRIIFGNEQKRFISDYLGEYPEAKLDNMTDSLTDRCEGLNIGKSTVQAFVPQSEITDNLARNHGIGKTSSGGVKFVMSVSAEADIRKNCIFIDETGFNIAVRRGFRTSGAPMTRAGIRSILCAISYEGIVLMSMRNPECPQPNQNCCEAIGPAGERSGYYGKFLVAVMDMLDQYPDYKNAFLVVDAGQRCEIDGVDDLISGRGYRRLYLPPYSPEFNPVRQVWTMIEGNLRRKNLGENETMAMMIAEAGNRIPLEDIRRCIDESDQFLER